MTSRLTFLFALVFALNAAAQSGTNNRATYSLTGIVQNSVTGEPIPHALVQIVAAPPGSTFTDAGGRFEFEKLSGGVTTVVARKPGFFTPEELQGEDRINLTFSGQQITHSEGPNSTVGIGPDAPP